jgi:hypothetical protein
MRLFSICFDLFGEESRQQRTLVSGIPSQIQSLATPENLDHLDDIRGRRRVNRSTGHIDSPLHASLDVTGRRRKKSASKTADGFALDWRVDTILADVSRGA